MIDTEFLKSRGYVVSEPVRRNLTYEEVLFNLPAYFENYPKFDFWFVPYPDECIEVSRDGVAGSVFGKCSLGCFLEDSDKIIRLISSRSDSSEDEDFWLPDLISVNGNINEFYQCYMIFMASVYELKSNIVKLDFDRDRLRAQGIWRAICEKLKDALSEITDVSSDEIFWGLLIYMLEDGYFPIRFHLQEYTRAGKIDY